MSALAILSIWLVAVGMGALPLVVLVPLLVSVDGLGAQGVLFARFGWLPGVGGSVRRASYATGAYLLAACVALVALGFLVHP